jgi:hypothetical protein
MTRLAQTLRRWWRPALAFTGSLIMRLLLPFACFVVGFHLGKAAAWERLMAIVEKVQP